MHILLCIHVGIIHTCISNSVTKRVSESPAFASQVLTSPSKLFNAALGFLFKRMEVSRDPDSRWGRGQGKLQKSLVEPEVQCDAHV